ncbi:MULTISPECIES: hypothetical protein [Thermomonosporaceae]|uniref:hypothetical protein n=1 Tax=Thermomonosporaceae TaxID=2012 RepID=UPI00255A8091|nr:MULTISPECIES: hypothetical protein [Thermomonosporaceae]MDL4776078.1 hypothetical protein [Actinomadura xylanilytica]
MTNGARHGLGVVIGLIATPLVLAGLCFGTYRMSRLVRMFLMRDAGSEQLTSAAVLVAVAVVLGLVMGSRLSPLASLIPGFVLTALGLLWAVAPRWAMIHTARKLPDELDYGYTTAASLGLLLVIGVALVVASLAPSRWSARSSRPVSGAPAFAGPYGPPPPGPQGPPPARMDTPPAPQLGQPAIGRHAQDQPWQPPQQQGHGAVPLPPNDGGSGGAAPGSGAPSAAGESGADEPAGEWTQMYGGGDDRRGAGRPPA